MKEVKKEVKDNKTEAEVLLEYAKSIDKENVVLSILDAILINDKPPESINGWSWGMPMITGGGLLLIYNSKLKEYKEKQSELEAQMALYTNADESFYLNANILLHAVKKASQIFEGSESATKRQILNFILQNLKLDGKNLLFELKTPFNRMLEANRCSTLLRGTNDVRTYLRK